MPRKKLSDTMTLEEIKIHKKKLLKNSQRKYYLNNTEKILKKNKERYYENQSKYKKCDKTCPKINMLFWKLAKIMVNMILKSFFAKT